MDFGAGTPEFDAGGDGLSHETGEPRGTADTFRGHDKAGYPDLSVNPDRGLPPSYRELLGASGVANNSEHRAAHDPAGAEDPQGNDRNEPSNGDTGPGNNELAGSNWVASDADNTRHGEQPNSHDSIDQAAIEPSRQNDGQQSTDVPDVAEAELAGGEPGLVDQPEATADVQNVDAAADGEDNAGPNEGGVELEPAVAWPHALHPRPPAHIELDSAPGSSDASNLPISPELVAEIEAALQDLGLDTTGETLSPHMVELIRTQIMAAWVFIEPSNRHEELIQERSAILEGMRELEGSAALGEVSNFQSPVGDFWRVLHEHESTQGVVDTVLGRLTGDRVVDLGCGPGLSGFAQLIGRYAPMEYVGIDFFNNLGDRTTVEYPDLGDCAALSTDRGDPVGGLLVRADILAALTRMEADEADHIVLNGIDEHIINTSSPYGRAVIGEINRVLRPGGSIIGITNYGGLLDALPSHMELEVDPAQQALSRYVPGVRIYRVPRGFDYDTED